MEGAKLFAASQKAFAFLFSAAFAFGITACKDESWEKSYGPGTEVINADMSGWTETWKEDFTYESMMDFYDKWDLVEQNTKEEWSAYGVPASRYINPDIADNHTAINSNNNLVLTAFAQNLYSAYDPTLEEDKQYTYLKYVGNQTVAISSMGNAAKIIIGNDNPDATGDAAPDIVPGLGGVVSSKATFGLDWIDTEDHSKGKEFKSMRIEFRAKIVGGKGACPMIYLIPTTPKTAVDMTKDRYEIAKARNYNGFVRVMEHYNTDAFVSQYINSNYINNWSQSTPASKAQANINYSEFNTYMVEITKESVSMYVNNIRTLYYPRFDAEKKGEYTSTDLFPFDQEYNIILGVGMGNPPVEAKQTFNFGKASMEVDYIKYYTKD